MFKDGKFPDLVSILSKELIELEKKYENTITESNNEYMNYIIYNKKMLMLR